MLWIHPVLQLFAIILGWYVFHTGWRRFSSTALKHVMPFPWNRHVALGKVSLFIWIYGTLVGAAASWVKWRAFGVTGAHFLLGMIIAALALFGYWSGQHMDRHKKRRIIMPIAHGANNLILLLLSLISTGTGVDIIVRLIL